MMTRGLEALPLADDVVAALLRGEGREGGTPAHRARLGARRLRRGEGVAGGTTLRRTRVEANAVAWATRPPASLG